MARPVLGITACHRMVGSEMGQVVIDRYARAAMAHADVAALLVPALPDLMDVAEVAGRLDGILLTGSPSNVAPARYGEGEGDGPFDPARDAVSLAMIRQMIDAGKPVFGICRGFQEINVALGGTLRRDTSASEELLAHHAPDEAGLDEMFAHRHAVELAADGMLARAFGKTRAQVNSVHYQGVGRLADGLAVEARAPDGLVEAFSARPNGAPLLAVQWHPEWQPERDADSRAYFGLLGKALRGEL